jgi:hypothetical protein
MQHQRCNHQTVQFGKRYPKMRCLLAKLGYLSYSENHQTATDDDQHRILIIEFV